MAIEQSPGYCARCAAARLFTRTVPDVPHTAYLVGTIFLTVFTCGVGGALCLLAWFIHTVTEAWSPKPPFLCSACGQPWTQSRWTGPELSDKDLAAISAGSGTRQGDSPIEPAVLAGEPNAACRRRIERRKRRERLAAAIAGIPEAWDRLLRRIAGRENDLIYRFLWFLTLAALLIACTGLAAALTARLAG